MRLCDDNAAGVLTAVFYMSADDNVLYPEGSRN